MATRRKKVGIFNHAKYSQPVLRQISENKRVSRAVNKDIATLLNNNGIEMEQKSGLGPGLLRDISSDQNLAGHVLLGRPSSPKQIPPRPYQMNNQQPGPSGDRDFVNMPRGPTTICLLEELPQKECQNPFDLDGTSTPATKYIRCEEDSNNMNQDKQQPHKPFPKEVPMERIINGIMDAFPHITLRNDQPTDYAGMVLGMMQEHLIAAMENEEYAGTESAPENQANAACTNPLKKRATYTRDSRLNRPTDPPPEKERQNKFPSETLSDMTLAWDFNSREWERQEYNTEQLVAAEADESPTVEMDPFCRAWIYDSNLDVSMNSSSTANNSAINTEEFFDTEAIDMLRESGNFLSNFGNSSGYF